MRQMRDDREEAAEQEEINPFVVGQSAECSTFSPGYRGAWFRCEILRFRKCKIGIRCMLKYLDFPGDKPYRHKLHQYVPNLQPRQCRMMIRPEFPKVVQNTSSNLLLGSPFVRFNRDWEVGDYAECLVNWAYWECQVIQVVNQDTLRVRCAEAPFGEGGVYDVDKKSLRPGLHWSVELGWTVKADKVVEVPLVSLVDFPAHELAEGKDVSTGNSRAGSSDLSSDHEDPKKHPVESSKEKGKLSTDPFQGLPDAREEEDEEEGEEAGEEDEADVLPEVIALEELVNKVGFLKDVLQHGVKESLRARSEAEWQFSRS